MACELPPPGGGGKRGKTTKVFFPLLTPQTFLRTRLPAVARLNGGRRGHASVRRAAFGTLLCPAVTLRYPPRITVRGQTVQGACFALRKALLRSRVYPWSSKRPCGPLAFRRATEGSRGAKEGLGCQEGKGNHRCPVPSCLRRESPAFLRRGHGVSRPPKAAIAHAHSERKVAFSGAPLYRRKYTLC